MASAGESPLHDISPGHAHVTSPSTACQAPPARLEGRPCSCSGHSCPTCAVSVRAIWFGSFSVARALVGNRSVAGRSRVPATRRREGSDANPSLWTRTALRSCVPDEGGQEPAARRAQQRSWARRSGHGRGTGAPPGDTPTQGHTPRHSAPGSSRFDHATAAAAASSTAAPLLRPLDALCHSGNHTCQPQPTQPDRLPGARFGLLRSSTEIHRENTAVEFRPWRPRHPRRVRHRPQRADRAGQRAQRSRRGAGHVDARDIVDGYAGTLTCRARAAASVTRRRLGQPAILEAFKLTTWPALTKKCDPA
jgi:hypothetical protein